MAVRKKWTVLLVSLTFVLACKKDTPLCFRRPCGIFDFGGRIYLQRPFSRCKLSEGSFTEFGWR